MSCLRWSDLPVGTDRSTEQKQGPGWQEDAEQEHSYRIQEIPYFFPLLVLFDPLSTMIYCIICHSSAGLNEWKSSLLQNCLLLSELTDDVCVFIWGLSVVSHPEPAGCYNTHLECAWGCGKTHLCVSYVAKECICFRWTEWLQVWLYVMFCVWGVLYFYFSKCVPFFFFVAHNFLYFNKEVEICFDPWDP